MLQTHRRYQDVARELRDLIRDCGYRAGDRILTERQISDLLGVGRSLAREAVMLLEIQGLVEVRRNSGIYLLKHPEARGAETREDCGPFELLQARQVLESAVAGLAATTVTKSDILHMRQALDLERAGIGDGSAEGQDDALFHRLVAKATQNSVMVDTVVELCNRRERSSMWARLHQRTFDADCRRRWLDDHQAILTALQMRGPDQARGAKLAAPRECTDHAHAAVGSRGPDFDGYLFGSRPAASGMADPAAFSHPRP